MPQLCRADLQANDGLGKRIGELNLAPYVLRINRGLRQHQQQSRTRGEPFFQHRVPIRAARYPPVVPDIPAAALELQHDWGSSTKIGPLVTQKHVWVISAVRGRERRWLPRDVLGFRGLRRRRADESIGQRFGRSPREEAREFFVVNRARADFVDLSLG